MLFSRPTKSWLTMCGNTMMSRSGRAGRVRREAVAGLSLSFLKNMKAWWKGRSGQLTSASFS
jgi:hypothetical protein